MAVDVANWLRGLGLEQYMPLFREHAIDALILPSLTVEDLRDLGVTRVGHRRLMLNAIAVLAEGASPSVTALVPLPSIAEPAAMPSGAERRQVTVLFCDLVGSTALAERLDPEDMHEILRAYHKCTTDIIVNAGGFVARYMGDGLLAYFGYPYAHEDDAERGVRAGLALAGEVPILPTPAGITLQVRIGIATGLVVVGEVISSGEAQERGIIGQTPNLAARLQGLAEPDTVVIAETTRRLLGHLFDLRDLGSFDLKGISEPVRAWVALRAGIVEGRFEALHAVELTPLIGRGHEIDTLLRQWSRAKSSEGQALLISGEAGIGKSRLTVALLEHLASESHTRLRYFCSPQRADSELHPFIGQMERSAGFTYDDTMGTRLDKLDAVLKRAATPPEDAGLIADLLATPNDGRYPVLELTPPRRREKLLAAMAAQLEALSRLKPVLLIFEDVHWADPTSLEAIGRILDRLAKLPVLLIITFRPEFDPPWLEASALIHLRLDRLNRNDAITVVTHLIGNAALPPDTITEIIERTDGIPLFVEEMTKAVLEAGDEGATRRMVAAIPPLSLAVPASLQASLMARLDRLGVAAKEIAQIGAAIGRDFSHVLMAIVAGQSPLELMTSLDRLVEAGLLSRQGVPPDAQYLFKHALVQDAAYGTLLRAPRRSLHARIVGAYEKQLPDLAVGLPEVLARHCTEAGLIEKAAALWGKAGHRSLARSAMAEAVTRFTRALDQLASLPSTPAIRQEQINLHVALITPIIHLKGHASIDTVSKTEHARLLIERAEAMGEPPEDLLLLFTVLYGFCATNIASYNGDASCELAMRFLAIAEKQKAPGPVMIGHRLVGMAMLWAGNAISARDHLDQALSAYNPAEHRELAMRFGQDQRVTSLSGRSFALWMLGYPDAALRDSDHLLKSARQLDQTATLIWALNYAATPRSLCGDHGITSAYAEEQISIASEGGALFWQAGALMNQAIVLVLTGRAAEALEVFPSAMNVYTRTGITLWMPFFLQYWARAHAEVGHFAAGRDCIEKAIIFIDSAGERWCEPEVYRIAGEIALVLSEPNFVEAEAWFGKALSAAQSQQAKSWELRAAMSMGRLWRLQGKQRQAHDLLAPVYGWFTEGFATADIIEAKALLNSLV